MSKKKIRNRLQRLYYEDTKKEKIKEQLQEYERLLKEFDKYKEMGSYQGKDY